MAPEQMRAAMKADQRSDIWAIGVVLYELLEGARPFRSDVYSELVLKVGMDPPHPMENPGVPGQLQQIVMKCLEKPMDRRYQTVAELAFDLMPFSSDPVQARASVEQCARLLGRRSTKSFNAPRVEAETTPANIDSGPIPRLTPRSGQMAVAVPPDASQRTPISQSQPQLPPVATVLGRPTPQPSSASRTPTSVNVSSGEVTRMPKMKSRRGLWIGLTATACIAVGGGAIWYTKHDAAPAAASAPVQAPPPPVEAKSVVEPPAPPPPPPVAEEDVKREPTIAEPKPEPISSSGLDNEKLVKSTVKTPKTGGKKPPKSKTQPQPKPGSGSAVEVGGELYKRRQ
jgi:serine/threonine-protein kinase